MIDGKHSLHEVKFKPSDAGNSCELFPDERLLHRAIHVDNAVDGACR